MADICTAVTNPCGSGDHRDVTVMVDGELLTERFHNAELNVDLTTEEKRHLMRLMARLVRRSGVTIADMTGRVFRGEEATNVKSYDIIGPGAVVTKTNIGTAYVNVLPGLNGERALVDFTGCTQFRIILNANLIGTGQWGARLVRDSNSEVFFESANLGAAGERELDSDWQTLPAGFNAQTLMRLQAKSTTAADDPQFRRCMLLVR